MADASSDWVRTAYRSSYISCLCVAVFLNTCVEWVERECGARAVLVLGQLKSGSLEINPSGSLGPAWDSSLCLGCSEEPRTHTGTAVSQQVGVRFQHGCPADLFACRLCALLGFDASCGMGVEEKTPARNRSPIVST